MTTSTHRSLVELSAALTHIAQAPSDRGTVELIVRRPSSDTREVIEQATLTAASGLCGDNWRERGSRHTEDGSAEPERQITLMNSRSIEAMAGSTANWPPAGDQLYVDLDLSPANLPVGSRLKLGQAIIEVSAAPHFGCAKFAQRFGRDAYRFVNSEAGREFNLRGINAGVIGPGQVSRGDAIVVMARPEEGSNFT